MYLYNTQQQKNRGIVRGRVAERERGADSASKDWFTQKETISIPSKTVRYKKSRKCYCPPVHWNKHSFTIGYILLYVVIDIKQAFYAQKIKKVPSNTMN